MYVDKARSLPAIGAPEMCRPYKQTLDKAGRASHGQYSNLLQKFINYGRKKFYNIGPRANAKKTFYGRNKKS